MDEKKRKEDSKGGAAAATSFTSKSNKVVRNFPFLIFKNFENFLYHFFILFSYTTLKFFDKDSARLLKLQNNAISNFYLVSSQRS